MVVVIMSTFLINIINFVLGAAGAQHSWERGCLYSLVSLLVGRTRRILTLEPQDRKKKDNYCTEKETFPAGKNKLEGGQMGSDGLRQKGCPGAGISIQG